MKNIKGIFMVTLGVVSLGLMAYGNYKGRQERRKEKEEVKENENVEEQEEKKDNKETNVVKQVVTKIVDVAVSILYSIGWNYIYAIAGSCSIVALKYIFSFFTKTKGGA